MTIAYVRDTGKISASNVNTSAGSFGTLPAVGNHVFVQISHWHNTDAGITACTDNQGNTYAKDAEGLLASGSSRCAAPIFSTKVATSSGTFTITVDPDAASGNYIEWVATEFSGLDATTHLDRTGTGQSTTGDATATCSAANTGNDRLVLVVASVNNNDTNINIDVPTGYTSLAVMQDANATVGFRASYKIVSAGETSTVQWAHDNTGQTGWAAAIATYIAAAGAAAGYLPLDRAHKPQHQSVMAM